MQSALAAIGAEEEVVPASLAEAQPCVLAGRLDLDLSLRIERIKARLICRLSTLLLGVSFLFVVLPGVGIALWLTGANAMHWVGTVGQFTFAGLLLLGYVWGKPRIDAWRMRRRFQSGQLQPEQVVWRLTDSGLEMIADSIATRDAWDQLVFVGEAEDMLVLRHRGFCRVYCLPREFATDEVWNRLRDLVRGVASG